MHWMQQQRKELQSKDELMEEDNQNIEDIFNENDTKSQTIAQFGLDLSVRTSLNVKFMSTMEEVCIPYYVEGHGKEKVKADFG